MIVYFRKEAPEWLKQHIADMEAVGKVIDMAGIVKLVGEDVPKEVIDRWMSSMGYAPTKHVQVVATRYGQNPTPPEWFSELVLQLAESGNRMTAKQVAERAGNKIDTRAIGGWLRALGHAPRRLNGRTVFFG